MTIFYQERAKASPELPPRVITSSSELSQDHDFDEDFDDEEDEHHAIEAEEDISESKGSSERTSRQLNKDSPSTDFDEKLVGDKAVGGVDDPKCPSGSVGKCNNGLVDIKFFLYYFLFGSSLRSALVATFLLFFLLSTQNHIS